MSVKTGLSHISQPPASLPFQFTTLLEQCAGFGGIWQIDGETVETVSDFILGGSKITADGDCSHEIKRRVLLEKKVMTKPQ